MHTENIYRELSQQKFVTPDTIRALRTGDENAYITIYLAYLDPLKAFLMKLLGSADDADEVLQQVFMWVWEKREQIDPNIQIKRYLYVSMRNAAFNLIRNRKKQGDISELDNLPADLYYIAEEQAIAQDTELLINICIDRMPKNRKKVMQLYQQGYTYQEIAEKLQMTPANVRQHIKYGRAEIQELTFLLLFFFSA